MFGRIPPSGGTFGDAAGRHCIDFCGLLYCLTTNEYYINDGPRRHSRHDVLRAPLSICRYLEAHNGQEPACFPRSTYPGDYLFVGVAG